MFRNSYQKDFFTLFYSVGPEPFRNWCINTKNGHAKRVFDEDMKSVVMEIMGANVTSTYMTSPRESSSILGIRFPFIVLHVKNMSKYFTFEVKIMDDQKIMRRFRVSNFQGKTMVDTFSTLMTMGMSPGWNQINFNLADMTRRAYGTNYVETLRVQIHANVRVRRIYFSDRLLAEDELPKEYRLMPEPEEKSQRTPRLFKVPRTRPSTPINPAVIIMPNVPKTHG